MSDREKLLKEAHEDAMYRVQDMDGAVAFVVYRDAFIAAIEAAGVRLVPMEPTRHMLVAAHMVERDDVELTEDEHRAMYAAFLAASPYAPGG